MEDRKYEIYECFPNIHPCSIIFYSIQFVSSLSFILSSPVSFAISFISIHAMLFLRNVIVLISSGRAFLRSVHDLRYPPYSAVCALHDEDVLSWFLGTVDS